MTTFLARMPRRMLLILMAIGSGLITASSLVYFDFGSLPPFVIEKLPLRFEELWMASLRVHAATAAVAFPLCLLLMTRWLQRRPAAHRLLGRITGSLALVGLVPSGTVLAFDAKGGPIVTVGFLLSAAILAWFMVTGILSARRRNLRLHRRAMRHVVGQMSVAVTSRAMLIALNLFGVDPDLAYVLGLWVPVLGTVAVVELISLPSRSVVSVFGYLIERTRRVLNPLARRMRLRALARTHVRFGR